MEAIHTAAARGDVDALRRELESGVSPDQVGPHSVAESQRQRRLYPILLRAGALPPESWVYYTHNEPYLQKVIAAGSFQNYERAHLNAIAATFVPKFSHLLPPELVRRVAEYAFHVGDY